jgi:hypothetical protein
MADRDGPGMTGSHRRIVGAGASATSPPAPHHTIMEDRMATLKTTTCVVSDCQARRVARGLCPKHWWRLRQHGSTSLPPRVTQSYEERFWARVRVCGPEECWPWLGRLNNNGYGSFWNGHRVVSAHAFAWVSRNGPMPADKPWGLHHCDNPPCCNPSHIFPGTHADNVADMVMKGRGRGKVFRGEQHGMAKVDTRAVRSMRAAVSRGESLSSVARRYGLNRSTVDGICSGRLWRHV